MAGRNSSTRILITCCLKLEKQLRNFFIFHTTTFCICDCNHNVKAVAAVDLSDDLFVIKKTAL
jgi:hypothetical protein